MAGVQTAADANAPRRAARPARRTYAGAHRTIQAAERDAAEGRLIGAFATVEHFPAVAESRAGLLRSLADGADGLAAAVAAVESDVALICAVMRAANVGCPRSERVESVRDAIVLLYGPPLEAIADAMPTFDLFRADGSWGEEPSMFRRHALATRRLAAAIATIVGWEDVERLAVTSALHDIGKLVLARALPGYPDGVLNGTRTPGEQLHRERVELGIDHALIGGALLRRWGHTEAVARAVETHHDDETGDEAALIGLADVLAHYEQGRRVERSELARSARLAQISVAQLRLLLYELPGGAQRGRQAPERSPLTRRETEVLELLAEGNVYKEIARTLGLSPSSIRSHLHNIYGKLHVCDRAQAVLLATRKGWIREP